ncbi:MAG: histidine phosphatase family protein [Anaerolineae bacterium]|nr:histidine phosphatase family protein [Anaerolineae bacterium]
MQKLFLVRHGMRLDVEDRSWRETAERPDDPPLSNNGLRQARDVGAWLKNKAVTALYCSPFLRALQTAQGIFEEIGVRFRVEEALGEWLNPKWFQAKPQLWSLSEIQDALGGVDPCYRSAVPVTYPEPSEEVEVYARVRRFLSELQAREGGNVVLVGHGATVTQAVRALCGHTEGLDAQVCSITTLEKNDGHWQHHGSILSHLSVIVEVQSPGPGPRLPSSPPRRPASADLGLSRSKE